MPHIFDNIELKLLPTLRETLEGAKRTYFCVGYLFELADFLKVIDEIYRYPFQQLAVDALNRQFKRGTDDAQLAELAIALRIIDCLCLIHEDEQQREPHIICSLGLF